MIFSKKILFISKELISGDLAYRLKKEGCDVKLFIEKKSEKQSFNGLVSKTNDWHKELAWVGKNDGLIVFDDVGYGDMQDKLRKEGFLVFGGSGLGDRLELDRVFGQESLKINKKVLNNFSTKSLSINSAIEYVTKEKGKWVIKQNYNHDTTLNYIGMLEDGSDVINILEKYKNRFGAKHIVSLQKKVEGVEIAIGRFFNGKKWIGPFVINFEHKHFFDGDIGPLGGETGTLMWYSDQNNKLFLNTLNKLTSVLKKSNYKGYVDVNCIINEGIIFPLEITSRFGSSTIETQQEIHLSPWSDFLFSLAKGLDYELKYKKGYCINVALTVPPFPYNTNDKNIINKNTGIFFEKSLNESDFEHIHFEGVKVKKTGKNLDYYTTGNYGYVLYVTFCHRNIVSARKKVYSLINKIFIPNMFYRNDIGLRFLKKDKNLLSKWGWI
jgi:phosphoribosylamine---glycine ligase